MNFSLIFQPVMTSIFAGLKDARVGQPPYFRSLATDPGHRAEMLKDGWKSVGKVFVLAMILDEVFQIKALGTVYPGGAIFVAVMVAIGPNLVLRGAVPCLASHARPDPYPPGPGRR